jgi:CHAT domain-containing protein
MALQQSQIAMLSHPVKVERLDRQGTETLDLSHPFYWAGFTIVGSPW